MKMNSLCFFFLIAFVGTISSVDSTWDSAVKPTQCSRLLEGAEYREGMSHHALTLSIMISLAEQTQREYVIPCYHNNGRLMRCNDAENVTISACDVFKCPPDISKCTAIDSPHPASNRTWVLPGFHKDTRGIPVSVKEMKESNISVAILENASKVGGSIHTPTPKVRALNSHILDQVAIETEVMTYTNGNETNIVKMSSETFVIEYEKDLTCVHWRSEGTVTVSGHNNTGHLQGLNVPRVIQDPAVCVQRIRMFMEKFSIKNKVKPLFFWDGRNDNHLNWNHDITSVIEIMEHTQHLYWRLQPFTKKSKWASVLGLALSDLAISRHCKTLYVTPSECKMSNGFETLLRTESKAHVMTW